MSPVRQVHCLVIGDAQHPELCASIRWLEQHASVVIHGTAASAISTDHSPAAFDFVVLCQARPDQITAQELESLYQVWPLATFINLFGSWCEGETRTGHPLSGVWRISTTSFTSRMGDVLERWPTSSSIWHLPRLSTEAERLLCLSRQSSFQGMGIVAIVASTQEAYESIADAIGYAGFTPVWQRPWSHFSSQGIIATIWDLPRADEQDWQAVEEFWKANGPVPVVLLIGFPRPQDFSRAAQLPDLLNPSMRIAILPKPLRSGELHYELQRMTGNPAGCSFANSKTQIPAPGTKPGPCVADIHTTAAKSA
jgi:hypothetical protein